MTGRVKACDIYTDGRSAYVAPYNGSTRIDFVVDTLNDGKCTRKQYNMYPDGRHVVLEVCDGRRIDSLLVLFDCRTESGVS